MPVACVCCSVYIRGWPWYIIANTYSTQLRCNRLYVFFNIYFFLEPHLYPALEEASFNRLEKKTNGYYLQVVEDVLYEFSKSCSMILDLDDKTYIKKIFLHKKKSMNPSKENPDRISRYFTYRPAGKLYKQL